MDRLVSLFLVAVFFYTSSCAPAYKSIRTENFTGNYPKGMSKDDVMAHLQQKHVVLVSFYDGTEEKQVPQYILTIDSIDRKYLYGNLKYADFQYHFSGDRNFQVKELQASTTQNTNSTHIDPLDVVHIYTRFNNIQEGSITLNLTEIYAIDMHTSEMTAGGKAGLAGALVGIVAVTAGVVIIIVFINSIINPSNW